MEEPGDPFIPTLAETLQTGGVYYRVEGRDKASVLRNVVDVLGLPEDRSVPHRQLPDCIGQGRDDAYTPFLGQLNDVVT